MPSMGELLIVLVIVMLVFGAGKLPAIGDALGRSIKNFRRAASGNDELEVSPKEIERGANAGELSQGKDAIEEAEVVKAEVNEEA